MENVENKSASDNDIPTTTNVTNNTKMSNKEIREEYFSQLRSWLHTVNTYECYYNKFQQELLKKKYQTIPKVSTTEVPNNATATPETSTVESNQFEGIRCQIPSLWKRFGAEFIDYLLLSLVKFIFAYFLVDLIMNIDFTKYNIFIQDDFYINYNTVVEMTSELFFLEVAHRILVCVYEIYWLQGGNTSIKGGATIGKILLALTVVRTDKLFHIRGQPNDIIALTPGGNLGWRRAIVRSISKNLFFAFLFPLPFITAAENQNRCAYDALCGSMVVEIVQPLKCEQSEVIPILYNY